MNAPWRMLTVAVLASLLVPGTDLRGQQTSSLVQGTSSLTGLPGLPGVGAVLGFDAKGKALTFNIGKQTIWEPEGDALVSGLDLGAKVTGKAANDLASIVKSGVVVPEAKIVGHIGVRVWTPAYDTDPIATCWDAVDTAMESELEAVRAETDTAAKAKLQSKHDQKKRRLTQQCVDRFRTGVSHGGLWVYGRGGYKGASYRIFDGDESFEDQLSKRSFDGASLSLAVNFWAAWNSATIILGGSVGWAQGNNIDKLESVIVEDRVAESASDEGEVQRSVSKKDVVAFRGDYSEFGTVPVALDVMIGGGEADDNSGLWIFMRALGRSGDERDGETKLGAGAYVYKPGNPLLPLGAAALQWDPGDGDIALVLTSSIEIF